METDDNKIVTGIIAMILIALGLGSGSLMTENQFEDAYVCTSNDKPAYCTGNPSHLKPLSTTAKSCYYVNDLGESKYKRCIGGFFQPLSEYAEIRDIDKNAFILGDINEGTTDDMFPETKRYVGIKEYLCTPEGCRPK